MIAYMKLQGKTSNQIVTLMAKLMTAVAVTVTFTDMYTCATNKITV